MEKKKNNDDYPENVKYPQKEDIYNQEKKEELSEEGEQTENAAEDLAADLDVPGSELDDADELIGREDEENNYYSLGGDNHNDLDEDKGD